MCTQTHTPTQVHTDDTQANKNTDSQAFGHVCRHSSVNTQAPEEVGTSHLSFTLIFVLVFFIRCFMCPFLCSVFSISLSFTMLWYTDAGIVTPSQPLSWIKPLFVTHYPYSHTHDTIPPQEKPWARTGRKTLENQDTIWHLWSLNDFLLGVGLRPTGKSQKTGRENYIRENVYAAHSAPSLFAPQMSDYSSTLNLWERGGWCREGDSFHH